MEEEEIKPKATRWQCPECKQKQTFYVKPSVPPTCANPESHPKKPVIMVQKS